jgi:beta-lactamase regulating signal transducer with metallopeptidase domain
MSWLVVVALKNAILALPLAGLALLAGRYLRWPALAHLLWALVLVKLLTPPLIDVPVGWKLDVEGWLGQPAAENGEWRPEKKGSARVDSRESSTLSQRNAIDRPTHASHRATVSGTAAPLTRRVIEGRQETRAGVLSNVSWIQIAGTVWLAGSLAMLTILVRRAWRFRSFLNSIQKRDEYLGVRVAELAHAAGLRVSPRVIVIEGIVSPMLWGLGENARMIFPAQLARQLSPAKLDTLLLHELAHFARKDHWLRGLELAVCVVYWWNPLVWCARREIETVEEECCDAWVVERQGATRHSYAEALLTTVDFLCKHQPALPPAACGLGEVSRLRARLTQIMCGESSARLSSRLQAIVLTVGLLLSPLEPALRASSWTSPKPAPASAKTAANPHTASARVGVGDPSGAIVATPNTTDPVSVAPTISVPASQSMTLRELAGLAPPPSNALWATAISPNGKFRVEAKTGRRMTLIRIDPSWRLDLSEYHITCLSFAPDSRRFATGHEDAIVRLWDAETGGLLQAFKGSDAGIVSIQISPDGRSVAAGSRDGSLLIWDLVTGDETVRLPRQDSPVSCLRWSKSGDRLAITLGSWSEGEQAELLIWRPHEGITRQALAEPAGALDWLDKDQALIVAAWNGQGHIWKVSAVEPAVGRSAPQSYQLEPTGQIMIEKDQVSAAAWSPDCPLVSKWMADQIVRAK